MTISVEDQPQYIFSEVVSVRMYVPPSIPVTAALIEAMGLDCVRNTQLHDVQRGLQPLWNHQSSREAMGSRNFLPGGYQKFRGRLELLAVFTRKEAEPAK